ncbi:hypothetical protein DQG13_05245 [Paenibacillus sp. YN15]|nr:hypothetical protein DQG13_05245 [Paenibacillus sp. YN15]
MYTPPQFDWGFPKAYSYEGTANMYAKNQVHQAQIWGNSLNVCEKPSTLGSNLGEQPQCMRKTEYIGLKSEGTAPMYAKNRVHWAQIWENSPNICEKTSTLGSDLGE